MPNVGEQLRFLLKSKYMRIGKVRFGALCGPDFKIIHWHIRWYHFKSHK